MQTVITPTPQNYVFSAILEPDEAKNLVIALERLKRNLGRVYNQSKSIDIALQHNLVEDLIDTFTQSGTFIYRQNSKKYKIGGNQNDNA